MKYELNADKDKREAFTLVEIMVVVVIIGLLSVLGIPAFDKVKNTSVSTRIANDFRIFKSLYETYNLDNEVWPADVTRGIIPPEMVGYVSDSDWTATVLSDSQWDWEFNRFGYVASIALTSDEDLPLIFEKVDSIVDDGNLSTGDFIDAGDRYILILDR